MILPQLEEGFSVFKTPTSSFGLLFESKGKRRKKNNNIQTMTSLANIQNKMDAQKKTNDGGLSTRKSILTCRNLCSNRQFWFSGWALRAGRPQCRPPAGCVASVGWDVECYHPGRLFAIRKHDVVASDPQQPANGVRHPRIWNFPNQCQNETLRLHNSLFADIVWQVTNL